MAESFKDYSYIGKGIKGEEKKWRNLPGNSPDDLTHPSGYLAPSGLVAAVNTALELGMPLLLTGEPGCGKSQLAFSLAWELDFPLVPGDPWSKPLCFTVKSDTQGRDLFYNFDTLGRFHAARNKDEDVAAQQFLRFEALGLAILRAQGKQAIENLGLTDCFDQLPQKPQRSVVLIDEIDKAPREVPNDILNEIEHMSFEIPELFVPGKKRTTINLHNNQQQPQASSMRPVVIITSNLERELPEAFLRRCVYYHLDLPPFRAEKDSDSSDDNVSIESIIEKRLDITIKHQKQQNNAEKSIWAGGVSLFQYLRDEGRLQKPPSTAELLNWMQFLHKRCQNTPDLKNQQTKDLFCSSASVTLFKHKEDQNRAGKLIEDWLTGPAS